MLAKQHEGITSTSIVSLHSQHPENEYVIAKGDSAASQHYWRNQDKRCLSNINPCTSSNVKLPNNEHISATKQGVINISNKLSNIAKTAKILPQLGSASLISLGQLCDDDCNITLTKHKLVARKANEVILEGYRNFRDGLLDIPVAKTKLTEPNL